MHQNTSNTSVTLREWLNYHKAMGHQPKHFTTVDEGVGEMRGFMCMDCKVIFIFDKIIGGEL